VVREPYARWCESRGRVTSLSYSILSFVRPDFLVLKQFYAVTIDE
jgi:hypothetical protein